FYTDALTGLYNRSYVNQWLDTHIISNCAVISFDLDHFKRINDTYGHDVGDLALKAFADILKKNTRDTDVVARMGGEEFIVIMDNGGNAEIVADRIRQQTEQNEILIGDEILKFTVSCGIVKTNYISKELFPDIYKQVDNALYEAKNSGRNKIVVLNLEDK
ncbi:MAG: GGDEF domain-containing protein, partial [Thermoplasmata archaeon]